MKRSPTPTASLARQFARLMRHKASLEEMLPLAMTERRLVLLLLLWAGPVGIPEVRAAVRSMTGSAHYDKLHRLVHGRVTYVALRELESQGLVQSVKEGRRTFYRLLPATRRSLKSIFTSLGK